LVDFIVCFLTSYTNNMGKEEYDSIKIAKNYVEKAVFYFDLTALLGSNVMQLIWSKFTILGFTKIIRVRRLTEFINRLNLPE
jgi:hypothetical protein